MEAIDQILDTIPLLDSEEQNLDLVKTFSREEIYEVIKRMPPTKAPGTDGLQVIFFIKNTGI